jgi:hypothetical protein
MNNKQKRLILFLFGCIGTRSLLVYIATTTNKHLLNIMGYLALLPAIGFFYIYFTGSRKTGIEVFGDKIWWNNLRPIHGTLYSLFAYNAINGNSNAYLYLLVDVIFGLVSFLLYHFTNYFI